MRMFKRITYPYVANNVCRFHTNNMITIIEKDGEGEKGPKQL